MFFFLARVQEAKRKGGITGSGVERENDRISFTCASPRAFFTLENIVHERGGATNLAGILDEKKIGKKIFIILFVIIYCYPRSLIRDICAIWDRSPTWRRTTNVEIGHVGWSGIASELERSKIRGWTQW